MITISGQIITPQQIVNGTIAVENHRITAIGPNLPHAQKHYNFNNALITPGFIDIHTHGMGQLNPFNTDDILSIAAMEARFGTTAFLPTQASLTEKQYLTFTDAIKTAQKAPLKNRARIPGAHFEGPFINPQRKGGMDAQFLRPMNLDECQRYLDHAGTTLKLMTLSPELPGAAEVIALLKRNHVVASLGHSIANLDDLENALNAGLNHICHLFNTFDLPIFNEPGVWKTSLVDACLAHPALNCELICDMIHVSPQHIKNVAKILGPDRFIAITDSVTGAGFDPGEYKFIDGRTFSTKSGAGRLVSNDEDNEGLVGSVITMNRAFKNLVQTCHIDPVLAAKFTAANPARVLGLDNDFGAIQPGKIADLAVLDHQSFNCLATFVNGELAHEN